MPKCLLHYGLQRSGTNYTASLLQQNFNARILNLDARRDHPLHKHFRLYDQKDLVPEPQFRNTYLLQDFASYLAATELKQEPDRVLVISKNPYSWYLSLRNWAHKCNWPAVQHHYVEEYTLFYRRWMEFGQQDSRIIFLRYIDLIISPDATLTDLAEQLGLRQKWSRRLLGSWRSLRRVPQSAPFTPERQHYYQAQQYFQELSPTEVGEINGWLDPDWMAFMGYEIVSPSRAAS